jgi:hypothetical protein
MIRILIWLGIAALGALAFGTIALHRGEQINDPMWLVVAAASRKLNSSRAAGSGMARIGIRVAKQTSRAFTK